MSEPEVIIVDDLPFTVPTTEEQKQRIREWFEIELRCRLAARKGTRFVDITNS